MIDRPASLDTVGDRLFAWTQRHAVLLGILAVGLLARLWGIDFGLPYEGITYDQLTYEESKEVHRAFKLGTGEYVWSFGKGGMYLILFVEFGVYYLLSLTMGWVGDSRDFALSVLEDRTTAYLIGRLTVALMGTLTCLVIYALGRRLYDRRTALVAAVIGALSYFHVQFSTVINVDIGMVLALWTSVLLYVVFEARQDLRWLAAAGAVSGIAIAFKLPGGIVVPLIWAAIVTAPASHRPSFGAVKRLVVYSFSLAVALTVVAPEWLLWFGGQLQKFVSAADAATSGAVDESALAEEIFGLSNQRWGVSFRYLQHLVRGYNVVLTVLAATAFILGLARGRRWDILLGGVVVLYIAGMSSSSWTQPERYLLPIFPALWLLAARLLVQISSRRPVLLALGLAVVLALPVANLARAAAERSGLDTRVLAKHWIEQHVPAGSRVLMDAMQHRNIVGPPLNPDDPTLRRQLQRVGKQVEQGMEIGRGVNRRTLALYEEAQRRIPGPRYDLHSTVHGLAVQPLEYYLEHCFDYVVTSSFVTNRFAPGAAARARHPDSGAFYDQLANDPRFELVHQESAVAWRSSGPTITVYRVRHQCQPSSSEGPGT
jgi:4-amino-4-deoxy-L-arabinose transferase-like glycosyltransferase